MAEFTETETKLIEKYIQDENLHTSLRLIRESMEKLWVDTPRIIEGYTDHGNKHCERLVSFADKLLEANDGKKLTKYEMYLLLAGIYLHDIGMQCDVMKFPKIKEQAEKLGAEFELDFVANTASEYSIEEQNSIRKNHQYLSAAWISYAYNTGETVVGPAVKTIPRKLLSDLMDVCKYHSKLPITNCASNFTLYPEMRKKLVATLLRFSDEMDVDSNRVSIETVKNFSFDSHNSLYWWLHNLTTISFRGKNLILLKITLHPEDIELYGSLIQQEFIEEFKSKNQKVLDILAQGNIPIRIDSNSKVEEYEFSEKLPPEINSILDDMQKKDDPLADLANEIKTWLQVIKYEVTDLNPFDERTLDIKAVNPFEQRLLVRCIGGEINKKDVDELDKLLDRKTPQGWLISDTRVSQNARMRASEDNAFEVFTLQEFLKQKVWKQYFDILESMVEKENIPELYVDIGCYKELLDEQETDREEYPSLDGYIDDWLIERGKTHLSLLGEFGAGKTWFCRHYAYRQLKRYLKDPANQRLPLLITLRDFTKATTSQQLINDALLEQYKLPFVGSAFDAFKEMNRQGKLLLILDGFDEMARQVDYQTVVDNFWELATLVEENSKVILTSRNEYFRWAEESEKIFGGKEFERQTIYLAPPEFEVLYLKNFTDDQIREVIIKKKGPEEGTKIADRVLSQENLATMAHKPVLVELLLAALEEVNDNILENPAQIYLYATNKLLLRNIETKRTFTTTSDKLYFLCELAWEMIKSEELKIHYTEIPDRINSYFESKIKDQHELDTWDFDLRNQTLLHRNAAGYYEFAHKSLAEYFVAFKFAAELGILGSLYHQTYCEASGDYCQMPFEAKDISELIETFGHFALKDMKAKAICDLLCEMLSEDANEKLWQVIEYTRNKSLENVKFLGGNAATLLLKNKETLAGANLENTILFGADVSRSDLLTASVSGCDLRSADLIWSKFDEKILSAKLGENDILVYSKSRIKWGTEKYHDLLNTIVREFDDRKIGLFHSNARRTIGEKTHSCTIIKECNISKLIESREEISQQYHIKFDIYFEEYEEYGEFITQLYMVD